MSEIDSRINQLSPLKRALLELEQMQARIDRLESAQHEPIAIIGMGCRFPGAANSPDAYWQVLKNGVDAIRPVPPDRVEFFTNFANPESERLAGRHAGFLEQVDQFDPYHFGISPREAAFMDPQQRIFLEVAWEALEDAGQDITKLAGSRTGVFVGVYNIDYLMLQLTGAVDLDTYSVAGGAHSIVANRLSYLLDLQGPSIAVDTACSSSLVAVHLACQSLRNRDANLAIAGGVNLILTPLSNVITAKVLAMAEDGRCKTFDARADGIVRGEGCGAIVLKRLSGALEDNDNILAIIRGSASNQDGHTLGLTSPNGLSQQAVIKQALENAGISPRQISYVEAHGTGTPLGDPIEVEALISVLGKREKPCVIGSVKTNFGHLEAASGIAGLMKVVLSLRHGAIPPHLHFTSLNENIDLKNRLEIATELKPWPRGEEKRIAGVSSFGIGGTNAHVIVEEAPQTAGSESGLERPRHLLTLSAKSDAALAALAQRFATYLLNNRETKLADICYTASCGRAHFSHRFATTAHSHDQLADELREFAQSGREQKTIDRASGRAQIAFLFTGQGSQYATMGRELYESAATFRAAIDRCNELLAPHMDRSLLSILYTEGVSSLIHDTRYTQPALFAVEYALAQLWQSWGIDADAVMGHSVGEFVAACIAGVLSLEDGLTLVAERGRLISELSPQGRMTAVFANIAIVKEQLSAFPGKISIAAINGPENIVVAGEPGAMTDLTDRLASLRITFKDLKASHPFHTLLLGTALERFADFASGFNYQAADRTFISNLTGSAWQQGEVMNAHYWRRQLQEPVHFHAGIESLIAQGCRLFIEIGPHPTLTELGKQAVTDKSLIWLSSLNRNDRDWHVMLASLGQLYMQQIDIDWAGFERGHKRKKVQLPTYAWQRERYWLPAERLCKQAEAGREARWPSILSAARRQSSQAPIDLDVNAYQDKWQALDELALAVIRQTFDQFGLFQRAGEKHSIDTLIAQCGIINNYRALMVRWLKRLAAAEQLQREGDYYVAVDKITTTEYGPLWKRAEQLCADFPVLQFVESCTGRLAQVLTGQINPLETLFPEGSFTIAEDVYEHWAGARYCNNIARAAIEQIAVINAQTRKLRVLELGAGIGATTTFLLDMLARYQCEYYFTDISSLFLLRARDKFKSYDFIQYGLLNIEMPPAQQGYKPHSFDIVIAANVLHATRNLDETLANVNALLKPGGSLILQEATHYHQVYDISIALIDGWGRHDDRWRLDTPLLTPEQWQAALLANGFTEAAAFPEAGSRATALGYHIIIGETDPLLIASSSVDADSIDGNVTIPSCQSHEEKTELHSLNLKELITAPAPEQREIVESYLKAEAAEILRVPLHRFDITKKLKLMGLESLMAIEIRTRLKMALGVTVQLEMIPEESITGLTELILTELTNAALIPQTPTLKRAGINMPAVNNNGAAADRWLAYYAKNSNAALRLICLSYAGGSAVSYRDWADYLPESVELCAVQMPGRGARLGEPMFTSVVPLVKELAGSLLPLLDRPYALFGHSLGALVAFELMRELRRQNGPLPCHLFVSSRPAPHLPDNNPPLHLLDDRELITELERYNGIPADLANDVELLNMMLPVLRADLAIIDNYVYADEERFSCAITAMGGKNDVNVREEELAAWREQTVGRFTMELFSGDHFYWREDACKVVEIVTNELNRLIFTTETQRIDYA